MPFTTSFLDEGRGVLHVGSGILTGAELIAGAALEHGSAEGAPVLTHGLVDFTDVIEFQVTTAELRQLTVENQVTVARAPGALVAVVSAHSFVTGMTKVWASMTETGWRCEIFATRTEAEAWLRDTLAAPDSAPASQKKGTPRGTR